jgi:hypothetical protein
MPGFESFVKVVAKGDKLLAAVAETGAELQSVEPLRAELEQTLSGFKALLSRRDNLNAEKQVLSKRLEDEAHKLNDAVIDLKGMIKATLRSRNEKLVAFGMPPRRKVLKSDRTSPSKARNSSREPAVPAPTS